MGRSAFGDAFVAKIAGVGILCFRQLFQETLFFFGRLLDPFIEFVAGRMFYIGLFEPGISRWGKEALPVLYFLFRDPSHVG